MTTKAFHLGDILSVTTGLLVSPSHIGGVYEILQHMTGEPLWTHQLGRAMEECRPSLLEQHPDLASIEVPAEFSEPKAVVAWLAEQVQRFGEYRDVAPLAPEDHTSIDPIAELKMLRPDMPVHVIEIPPGEAS